MADSESDGSVGESSPQSVMTTGSVGTSPEDVGRFSMRRTGGMGGEVSLVCEWGSETATTYRVICRGGLGQI